jgi:hypothetical protein
MRQAGFQAIAGVVGNANITSATFDIRQIYRLSGQVVVGAGASTAGTLQLQYSNDPVSSVMGTLPISATNWSNLGTAVTVAGAAVQSILFSTQPFTDVGYAWLRAVYTDTSGGTGLGKVTVNLNTQGF